MNLNIIPIPIALKKVVGFSFMLLGAFGPMISSLINSKLKYGKGAALSHIKKAFDFRGFAQWFLVPVVLYGFAALAAWLISALFKEPPLTSPLNPPWLLLPYIIFIMYIGGGQEEFGWRGFALDRLLARYNDIGSSLILGILWSCWHIPLWFIAGSPQIYLPFPAFLLIQTSLSVIMTWIYIESRGSLMISMWCHTVSNVLNVVFPFIVLDYVFQYRYWVYCVGISSLAIKPMDYR